MSIFLDIQGFRNNGDFILKELAFVSYDGDVIAHHLFQAPFSFSLLSDKDKITNSWLSSNYHFLPWYSGTVKYTKLPLIIEEIAQKYDTVYVKGKEKLNFLKVYFPYGCNVVDLEEYGCPSLLSLSRKSQPTCIKQHRYCALSICMRLREWGMKASINTVTSSEEGQYSE